MKIIFEDSSYLEVNFQAPYFSLSMCGKKGNKLTMTSTTLTLKQAEELLVFLQKSLSDGENNQ